jgi:D-lactate dehydrogenase
MLQQLEQIIPKERIRSRLIDLLTFASDASFYELIPQAVVQPINEGEVIALMKFSQGKKIPLVFRTGGTSLSGQSITDGILVDLSQHWNRIKIESAGDAVRTQPGITGAMVNAYLKPYHRKIGPDPSSISAAMMGGILSNNASGMCCGVKLNSYHTLKYIRFIIPDGKLYSTESPEDYERFEQHSPELFNVLTEIRKKVLTNTALYDKIRKKYQTKTTIGYSLNAFIDFNHPLDILAHILIGAEGTLAFIAESVLHTVPDYPYKSTALLYFPTIYDACSAIVPLTASGAMMVELMDRASLHAIENLPGVPAVVKNLPESASALLVEFQEDSVEQLDKRVSDFLASSAKLSLLGSPEFTRDPKIQELYWKVRKGLFPAVGAVRATGTTVILEDIAFPVHQLGDAILDLQKLFVKYQYNNAIIFGHAKDGNIHFVVTQSFNNEAEVTRYHDFMAEVVELVVKKYDGTLKAEHGTGRNMAPFVETEWGGEAYEIMKLIKKTIDPNGYLNPGVIINEDKRAHIKNLKALPSVEEEVDRCIECGYCEHRCPSRNITTTPRRRIVARRALKKLEANADGTKHSLLLEQYQYDGLETCAVDGLCAPACPVDINTGDLVKRLRRENHSVLQNTFALWVAKNFGFVETLVRTALKTGSGVNRVFGNSSMTAVTKTLKRIIKGIPLWTTDLHHPPNLDVLTKTRDSIGQRIKIIYFPACISRLLGTYPGKEKNLLDTFMSVCDKSGFDVEVLKNYHGSCCGQIFSSKGFEQAYRYTAKRIVNDLWQSSEEGKYPIVIDVSSCAYTLKQLGKGLDEHTKGKYDRLKIFDAVEFLHDFVIPVVQPRAKKNKIVVHPVCSLQKLKAEEKLIAVARVFASEVTVPLHAGCCGMAGDRGFLFPELTASATAPEASDIKGKEFDAYYSSTKTCEIAMSQAVSKNYESILYLVDEAL